MSEPRDQTLHLNCTQCGAGLDVLGGGRVKTHVCSYCGAELDAQDDYKIIQQFRDMERPGGPFELGMTGQLWGVEFTVIGTMAWTEYYGGKRWDWVDHQVFSPTHGYGWLTVDNGYVTYSRKTRDVPSPANISDSVIENADNRPMVRFQGTTFRYYGSGRTSPTFIEGEFNFRPSMEDSVRYVELMGGTRMLSIIESGKEREYEVTELPDQAAVLDSFGVIPARRPRPRGTHPLDALDRTPLQLFVRNLALAGSAAAIVVGVGLSAVGEKVAQSGRPSVKDGITLPFEITTDRGLTQITLFANATNSWAWFEGELTDANDEPVAEFERGIEFYKGSDWSEGSRTARTRLTLEPGEYTLYLSMVEGEQDFGAGQVASIMTAEVHQGVANAWWMWAAAGVLGLIGFLFLGQRYLQHNARWSGSDWSDD